MVFLSPLFLFGLAAVALPLAIHFIRREKPPKLMFGSIRFLKATPRKLVLFQHLQQWLLLLLRAALIALLAVAFARPLFNLTVARLLDADPQSAVILLDASMSMRFDDNFAAAKRQVGELLDTMSGGDEVALIVFSERPDSVREFTTDVAALRAAVADLEAGYGGTAFLPVLRLADQLLEDARFQNRAIHLISDFQAGGMPESGADFRLAAGVALHGHDVGSERSANLAISDVRAPERLLEDSAQQTILARVRSTGSVHLERGEVQLWLNDSLLDSQPLDLRDLSEQVFHFEAEFAAAGTHVGEVRLSGDDFAADNSYFFTVDVVPRTRVLAVNGEASAEWHDDESHWFGIAVAGNEGSPFALERILPEELNAARLARADAVALLNVGTLTDLQAAAVGDFLAAGGGVLFAPGDRVEAESFNRQFGELAPARLLDLGLLGRDDYLVIADYDRRHPILRPLDSDWSARFRGRWQVTVAAEASVLMRFDSAEPALVERNVGQGKALLFASALDLELNNLALQGLYLPFVHQALRYMTATETKRGAYAVGDMIDLNPGAAATAVTAMDPAGETLPLAAGSFVTAAVRPGLIRGTADGEPMAFAVNPRPAESHLERQPFGMLFDDVINPETGVVLSREERFAALAEELERPQRLWWWILCLVALLLVVESLIANRTYR